MKKLIASEKELLKTFIAVSLAVLFCILILLFISGQADLLTRGYINGAAKDNEYLVETMAEKITASASDENQAVAIIQSAPSSGTRYWFLLSSDSLIYEMDAKTTSSMGNLSYSELENYYVSNGGVGVSKLFELINAGQNFSAVLTKRSTFGAELISTEFIQIGGAKYCLGSGVSESYLLSAAGIGERTYNVKIMTLIMCFIIIALTSIFSLVNRKKVLQTKAIQNDLAAKNILIQLQSEKLVSRDADNMQRCDDVLTGLYNRKFFESLIAKLEERNAENIGIIYLRISNLQALSDKKGAEDINLLTKNTAKVLTNHADAHDICARISKKEFIIIKINTTKEATALAAHLLINELNALDPSAKFAAGFSFKDKNMTIESVLEEAYEIQSV